MKTETVCDVNLTPLQQIAPTFTPPTHAWSMSKPPCTPATMTSQQATITVDTVDDETTAEATATSTATSVVELPSAPTSTSAVSPPITSDTQPTALETTAQITARTTASVVEVRRFAFSNDMKVLLLQCVQQHNAHRAGHALPPVSWSGSLSNTVGLTGCLGWNEPYKHALFDSQSAPPQHGKYLPAGVHKALFHLPSPTS